jgi:hypothetical protein
MRLCTAVPYVNASEGLDAAQQCNLCIILSKQGYGKEGTAIPAACVSATNGKKCSDMSTSNR